MFKRFFCILILTLLLPQSLVWASFYDYEAVFMNVLTISTLDFSLFSPQDNFVPRTKTENMEPGDHLERMIQVRQQGNLPFLYSIRTEKLAGDDIFCNALQVQAKLTGQIKYAGNLMDLSITGIEMIGQPTMQTWQFKAFLPSNADQSLENKLCFFKFVFEAKQINSANGFSDQEEITNSLTTAQNFPDPNPDPDPDPDPQPPLFFNRIKLRTILNRAH